MTDSLPITDRMQIQINSWESTGDRRATFLSCYRLMTQNILSAIDKGQFNDPEWVYTLLHHFAGYYFTALEQYQQNNPITPAVWRRAFDSADKPDIMVVQNLLLGINAHINYDLIFAMTDMLEPDWLQLSPDEQQGRYDDFVEVNQIINQTVDAVQDTIIEPLSPSMGLIDELFGPIDEWVVSHMITEWRDEVWQLVLQTLDASDNEREELKQQYDQQALKRAKRILLDISDDA